MSEQSSPTADESSSDASQREAVRDRYRRVATDESDASTLLTGSSDGCCGDTETTDSCCGDPTDTSHARTLGYTNADLELAPEGTNLGLGCGNPTSIASLESGETVLDLGSGGGFDCFLAAHEVGPEGRVIGVDMTPEMVERARAAAARKSYENVEFRLGEIEHLPVPDATVDVVISNCVLNLSPEKPRVFEEIYRVLQPGGRMSISDIVLPSGADPLESGDANDLAACITGAEPIDSLERMLEAAGFEAIDVGPKAESEAIIESMYGKEGAELGLQSGHIQAVKPDV